MNKGFFFEEEEPVRKKKKSSAGKTRRSVEKKHPCLRCKLSDTIKTAEVSGQGNKNILVIIENNESLSNLKKHFAKYNTNLLEDCFVISAIQCTVKNKSTGTINNCRQLLHEKVKEICPDKIITFGTIALQVLIGHKVSVTGKSAHWFGWDIPDQEFSCFIFPIFHWKFLSHDKVHEIKKKRYFEYLKKAIIHDKRLKKYANYKNSCFLIQDKQKAIKYLQSILENDLIVFDYETTGLKPHRKNHKILCVSICKNRKSYAFPVFPEEDFIFELTSILSNSKIKKVAHNIQFENLWSREILKTEVKGWHFDTQLSTHIIDNRSNITGLKFQTYVNFGITGYDNDMKGFIESTKKGANEFNKLDKCVPEKVLLYNAVDSYFTYLLYEKHFLLLDDHLKKGLNLFLNANIGLSSLSGIRFDIDLYNEYYEKLTKQMDTLHNKIMNSREVALLKDKNNFNYNSDKQLKELLFNVCKWTPKNRTASGAFSVDEESLTAYNKKLTDNIVKRRKLAKIRDTYLDQFHREAVQLNNDYYIFPFYNLNIPVTYRSSSYNPNFQNIPKRNKLAKMYCRSLLKPRKNHFFMEADGKAMEVAISCCYHKDPVMVDYVTKGNDMHADLANKIFFRNYDYIDCERFITKNGFTFPQFYGSTCRIYKDEDMIIGAGEVTQNLWEMTTNPIKNYLAENGIYNIHKFQKHLEKIESEFWGKTFKVYQEWKWDNWREYKEKGYIELLSGFRCTGIMSFNDVNNYPVQGTAFHVLLKMFSEIDRRMKELKMDSKIIGQIHDSLVFDVNPSETDDLLKIIKDVSIWIRTVWTWINVPLTIEIEKTEIDEGWNLLKEYCKL